MPFLQHRMIGMQPALLAALAADVELTAERLIQLSSSTTRRRAGHPVAAVGGRQHWRPCCALSPLCLESGALPRALHSANVCVAAGRHSYWSPSLARFLQALRAFNAISARRTLRRWRRRSHCCCSKISTQFCWSSAGAWCLRHHSGMSSGIRGNCSEMHCKDEPVATCSLRSPAGWSQQRTLPMRCGATRQ